MGKEAPKSSYSRRTFLKGGVTAAVAAVTSAAVPVAFADDEASASDAQQTAASGTTRNFTTYTTDVCVIGSGLGGIYAAFKAYDEGASVLLVDKGPYGKSGASGINWGHDTMSYEESDISVMSTFVGVRQTDGLADQTYFNEIIKASNELALLHRSAEYGTVLESQATENSPHNMDQGFLRTGEPVLPRFHAQALRRTGVQIIDRTMMLDILLDENGAAAGIVGLNLVDGTGVVVRSKAVVMCPGAPCWVNGWTGAGAKTSSSPENTGDGLSLLLRHGVPVKNMEMWEMYMYHVHPNGIAFSQGLGVSAGDHPENMMNAKGEYFLRDNEEFQGAGMGLDRNMFELFSMREVYEGRGSENGGLFYDITHVEEEDYVMAFNRRIPENMMRGLDYKVENPVEIVSVPFECGGAPHLEKNGETQISGLFWSSQCGGAAGMETSAGGWIAGRGAAALAASKGDVEVDMAQVQDVLNRAFAPLEAAPSDAVRPTVVMHAIQSVMNKYCFIGKTEKGLLQAIADLQDIKQNLFPRMATMDKSTHFNQEWRQALEVPAMWDVVMATAYAGLTRTESRSGHHRLDHPKCDNKNWLKNVYVEVDEEGNWSTFCKGIVDTTIASQILGATITTGSVLDEA